MHDGQIEIPGLSHHFGQRRVMRRRVDQLAVRDQCRRLRKPGRVPEGGDLTFRLVTERRRRRRTRRRRGPEERGCALPRRLSIRSVADLRLRCRPQRSVPRDGENLSPPADLR